MTADLRTRNTASITPVSDRDGIRPYCLNRDSCAAKKPTTHCRRCSGARLKADPAIEARRAAASAAYLARQDVKEALAERIIANQAKSMADPVKMERLREHGRRQAREILNRPDVIALNRSSEVRAKAGASITETRLSWCPADRRSEYRELIRTKGMTAAEAREAIEVTIPGTRAHGRLAVANAAAAMRLKHERQKAQEY